MYDFRVSELLCRQESVLSESGVLRTKGFLER